MREIKFRLFYKPDGEFKRVIAVEPEGKCATFWSSTTDSKSCYYSSDGTSGDAVLMEYTGIKDMHGVEIYEGDLVRIPRWGKRSREVFYDAGMFKVDNDGSGFSLASTLGDLACEVVGNMYEGLHV